MKDPLSAKFEMKGRIALVTGAGRGIGLNMARALAAAGCVVALQDVDLEVAEKEAKVIISNGGKAVAFGGDITDLSLPARLVADVVQQLGGLHVLVNNASIQTPTPWMKVTANEMQDQFRADLISPILFIQQVWPLFKAQRFGRIINLGSIQQRSANLNMLPYSLSKAALEKLTVGLSREMAKANVTVNQIAPGWINTYRNRDQLSSPEITRELGKQSIPIGRIGEPADFEGIILLLCSEAGAYITGQNIYVDGGMGSP